MTTPDYKTLLAAATPGPWEVDDIHDDVVQSSEHFQQVGEHWWERQGIVQSTHVSPENARLIAAAPTAIAELVRITEGIRELHKPSHHFVPYCEDCVHPYPCPTIALLDQKETP